MTVRMATLPFRPLALLLWLVRKLVRMIGMAGR